MATGPRTLLEPLQDWKFRPLFFSHASTAMYLAPPVPVEPSPQTVVYNYDEIKALWFDVKDRRVGLGSRLNLNSFVLSEWFPRSPGRYFTDEAESVRKAAQSQIVREDKDANQIIYDPDGKLNMINGGIGTIRLNPIDLNGKDLVMMSACANGTAHQGFPIAVPWHLYQTVIDEIRNRGFALRSVTGELKNIPEALVQLYEDYTGIPKVYLMVDAFSPPKFARDPGNLEVTVALSFLGTFKEKPGMYATFDTFDPSNRNGLRGAVDWISDAYVRGMYDGMVLTDFDEQENHFRGARFSLSKVMHLDLKPEDASIAEAQKYAGGPMFIGTYINLAIDAQQHIYNEIVKYKITGGQQVAVGDNARADQSTQTSGR